jgi:hypothetical protein
MKTYSIDKCILIILIIFASSIIGINFYSVLPEFKDFRDYKIYVFASLSIVYISIIYLTITQKFDMAVRKSSETEIEMRKNGDYVMPGEDSIKIN